MYSASHPVPPFIPAIVGVIHRCSRRAPLLSSQLNCPGAFLIHRLIIRCMEQSVWHLDKHKLEVQRQLPLLWAFEQKISRPIMGQKILSCVQLAPHKVLKDPVSFSHECEHSRKCISLRYFSVLSPPLLFPRITFPQTTCMQPLP